MRTNSAFNNNLLIRFILKITNSIKGFYKFLNKSLFEVKNINIYVQDVVVFLIGIIVILVSVHYLRKSFKHPVKVVKVVTYKPVAPVPSEKWNYIKYFTFDNDQYVPALNNKSDTYYSFTQKLPKPIISDQQSQVLDNYAELLHKGESNKVTTLSNLVNFNPNKSNITLQQISPVEFDINKFLANHTITYDPPQLNIPPKAPILHWYCGPYLVVADAIKYLNRVNQVAQYANFGDIYTNQKFYYVKVSRELSPTEVKVLARYYHLNCEINLNLDSYYEYDSDPDAKKPTNASSTDQNNDDNGNDLIGLNNTNDSDKVSNKIKTIISNKNRSTSNTTSKKSNSKTNSKTSQRKSK